MRKRLAASASLVAAIAMLAGCQGSPDTNGGPAPTTSVAVVDDRDLAVQLDEAVKAGDIPYVEALVAAGADLDTANGLGYTPLHLAIFRGDVEVVKTLIEAGADLEARNPLGDTTLIAAAGLGNIEIAGLLIDAGADLYATSGDTLEPTALHRAASEDQAEMIQFLVDEGIEVDVYAGGPGRWTPLHFAAEEGTVNAARVLLENGADPNAIDLIGDSPVDYAQDFHFTELEDLLAEYGGVCHLCDA